MSNETTEQQEDKQETIPVPTLDYDAYRGDLRNLELTAEQENELLAILFDIMKTMVDLSLNMDAVQMVMPPSLYGIFNGETGNQPDTQIEQKSGRSSDTRNGERNKPNG